LAPQPKLPLHRRPVAITSLYLVLSICWVVVTDQIIHFFGFRPPLVHALHTTKGGIYVIVSAILLYMVLRRLERFQTDLQHLVEVRTVQVEKSQTRLRESEESLRRIVSAIPDITWTATSTGQTTYVSQNVVDVLGYTVDEMCDGTATLWIESMYPDDRERVRGAFLDLFVKGAAFDQVYRMRHKNGSWRWVRDRAIRNHTLNGVQCADGICSDVTELKVAQIAVERSDREHKHKAAELQMVLDAAGAGVFDMHLGTGALHFSPEMHRLYGFEQDEFKDSFEQWAERIYADDRVRALQTVTELMSERQAGTLEFRIIRKNDGELRWMEARGEIVRDERGRPVRYIGINTDITDRKNAESELRSLQQQFQHAQKMEAIGRLAGGIAHDFNNLLQVINAYAAMLEPEVENDRARRRLSAIRDAGNRAAELTSQLLAFSRRKPLEPIIVCIDSVLHSMERMIHPLIGESIQFSAELNCQKACVRTDPGQLEQVVLNLVVNARDAMPNGGRLSVRSALVTLNEADIKQFLYGDSVETGSYVCISVSDTGHGIEPAMQPLIFEPFFTTKEPGKGTGLGLSTTYAIVKQSRGAIKLDSKRGAGTTFSIYLPATQSLAHKDTDGELKPLPHGTETILVAEDDLVVRALVTEVLTELGYRVLCAADGQEALALAQQNSCGVDAVLSDVVMPHLSGVELCRTLKTQRPATKFILMSGFPGHDFNAAAKERMFFLRKPFTAAELANRVREVLEAPHPAI
jgi:two-component system, cell cycle sensor histidine kinase and response regulator CckA